MLHRSFKPAKCKTSLKLSVSRIKLLKNKKASQVLQLKKELAKLLESGQDQTARIRVEHLVREEKTIAAYDLIEIYCELIAARLPIIESQKNCPIDLKEAITSVIFASPRCSDMPELLDVRKQFTAKYGKEFISSVVELRPECGVNRSLVEKLSAIAPDGQTKIKILSAIAEEHNIQWAPTSFGEKQTTTPEDLLQNGPNTFEKSSKMHAETLPAHDQKHVVPADLNAQNARSLASIQHDAFAEHDSNRSKSPSNFHPYKSGVGSEEMEFRRESSGERNEFYVDRKNWNMEFKDATAAAQAAAESAERASMAARAAAELSNQERIVRQYSRESQKSSFHDLQDARPRNSVASKLSSEHRLKDPSNSFSHCNNPRIHNEEANENEKDNMGGVVQASSMDDVDSKRYSRMASLKSNVTYADEDLSVHNFEREVRYPPRNDFEGEYMKFEKGDIFDEVNGKEQASKFVGSNFKHDLSQDLPNSFSDGKNPWIHREKTNGKEKVNIGRAAETSSRDDDDNTNGYSGIASFKSYAVSKDEDLLASSFQNAGRYPHMNDFVVKSMKLEKGNSFDEADRKEQASESEVRLQCGLKTENVDYMAEPRCPKQSSNVHGESLNYQGHGNDDRNKGFFVDAHQTDFQAKTELSNSYDNVAAVFDDSASDEDEHRLNLGHDHIEQKTYFPSPNGKSQWQNSVDPKAWSPTRNENESALSNFTTESYDVSQLSETRSKSFVTLESEDIAAVAFDESNGPSSESEVEDEKPKFIERTDEKCSDSSLIWSHHRVTASSFKETERTASVDKYSHSDSLFSGPSGRRPKPQLESTDEVKHPLTLQTSSVSFTRGLEDNAAHPEKSDNVAQDIEMSDGERNFLSFGPLMGGRRNKGYKHPPYVKNPSNKASSSSSQLMFKDNLNSSAHSTNPEVSIQEPIDKGTRPKVNIKDTSRTPVPYLNSAGSSDEEFPQKTLSSNWEPSKQKVGMKEDKISRGRAAPITYFDSDSEDSEYNLGPRSANKSRSGSGISQRRKVSPPGSRRSSYSNVKAEDEVSIASDYVSERKAFSRRSMATETRPKHQPNDTSSSHLGSSKPMLKSEYSLHTEGSKASGKEQASVRETPMKEGSTKAIHVHPKLPDFDTISAQLASMRLNRQ